MFSNILQALFILNRQISYKSFAFYFIFLNLIK